MELLILSFVVLLANALPEVMSWEDWLDAFDPDEHFNGKFSVSPKNRSELEQTYSDNIKLIQEHNARHDAGLETFRLGVNQFTAMSYREWSTSVLGCLTPRTRPAVASPVIVEEEVFRRRIFTNVTSIDWREKNVVTRVKNQGSCGSCWAFSATGSIEVAVAIETGNLISLSEQQLMDCSRAEGDTSCEGGLMDNAFEYVEYNHGLDSEADYPYEMKDDTCKTKKERIRVSSIQSFRDVAPKDEQAIARAVQLGAVSVAIEADQVSFMLYRSGVYTAKCGQALDHGVLIVGYGTTKEGLDYWIVKNSWGVEWGEQGYILLERNIEDPAGKCGIALQPSFPIAGPQPKHYPTKKPSPRPAPPSRKKYERPVNGSCNRGEFDVSIEGVPGSMCLPKCHRKWIIFEACPRVPTGFVADAECLVGTPEGIKLCVLTCDIEDPDSCKPDEGCNCRATEGIGLCTYDDN